MAVAALAEFGAVVSGKLSELGIGCVGIRPIGLDARDGLAKTRIRSIQPAEIRTFAQIFERVFEHLLVTQCQGTIVRQLRNHRSRLRGVLFPQGESAIEKSAAGRFDKSTAFGTQKNQRAISGKVFCGVSEISRLSDTQALRDIDAMPLDGNDFGLRVNTEPHWQSEGIARTLPAPGRIQRFHSAGEIPTHTEKLYAARAIKQRPNVAFDPRQALL